MAGYSRAETDDVETTVKLTVVGPDRSGCSSIWRREKIRTTHHELDDVAFLTGSCER